MASANKSPTYEKQYTHEGAVASRISAEEKLKRTVMSCLLWEDGFYENGELIADRIKSLVIECGTKAIPIMRAAKFESKLRHVPLYMARVLASIGKLKADDLADIITRADEPAEFLAMYWQDGKQPLAKQVKLGLAKALRKFDEYSLAKYDRAKEVKLRDVFRIIRPTPANNEQAELWGRVLRGELKTPDTWEVALSSGADKKQTFTRLINEGMLGDLAFLRNLRNMQESGVSKSIIIDSFSKRSFNKILPFQFINAAQYYPGIEASIEVAMIRAMADFKRHNDSVSLLVDVSGSMDSTLSKGNIRRIDAAKGLAIIAREVFPNVNIYKFNNNPTVIPNRRGFALSDAIGHADGGTDVINSAQIVSTRHKDKVMIIITDEQTVGGKWEVNKDFTLFIINVATCENGVMYQKNVHHINGWSENVMKYILAVLDKEE
jgi:hypothetical protein